MICQSAPDLRTRIEDVSLEEMERRHGEQEYIDAMEYVQNAEFFPLRASAGSKA